MKNEFSKKREVLTMFGNMLPFKKKVVIVFVLLIWLISTLLVVLASTDLFKQNMFSQKYMLTNLLLLLSTISTIMICAACIRR